MRTLAIVTSLILSACAASEQVAACGFDPATKYDIRTLPNGFVHESITLKDLITGPDAETCPDVCTDTGYVITCPLETFTFHDANVGETVTVIMTRQSDNVSTSFELTETSVE